MISENTRFSFHCYSDPDFVLQSLPLNRLPICLLPFHPEGFVLRRGKPEVPHFAISGAAG